MDIERGPEAAQEAAVKAFAELADVARDPRVDRLVLPAQADPVTFDVTLNVSFAGFPHPHGQVEDTIEVDRSTR